MPSFGGRTLIVNEWLLEDLAGRNGDRAQQEAMEFLIVLTKRSDKIAVAHGTPWAEKAYKLLAKSTSQRLRRVNKLLFRLILYNPDNALLLAPNELEALSTEIADQVPKEDHYLARTYLAAGADVLVTTDETLYGALTRLDGFEPYMRQEFLRSYLA